MKRFQKHLILITVLVGLTALGMMMMSPHSASAAGSSPVQVVPNTLFGKTASGGAGLPPTVTVPSTHHLVIETLSLQVDVTPSGSKLEALVNYTRGGQTVTVFVPLTYAYTTTVSNFDTYVATQEVRLYADPGSSVTFTPYTPTGSFGTPFMSVSGYEF